MIQQNVELLMKEFQEVLCLDLDIFGLEPKQDESINRFTGLRLRSAFQPIWDSANFASPLGYEALLRPLIGDEPVSPAFAFSVANNHGKLVKLDRVARTLHMFHYLNLLDNNGLLFVNVHPDLLANVISPGKVSENTLQTDALPPRRVAIEITENAVEADRPLLEAVNNYRAYGYRIALDNFGSKHSNFDRLWKLSPDFVKLDTGIIQRAQTNQQARRVLPKMLEIIREHDAQAIVVGIENETQYRIALDAGATLFQGYYLGRPTLASDWIKPLQYPILSNVPTHFGSSGVVANAERFKR